MQHLCHANFTLLSLLLMLSSLFLFDLASCFPAVDGSSGDVGENMGGDGAAAMMTMPQYLKRAGFVGMRGKKSSLLEEEEADVVPLQDEVPRSWMDQEVAKRAGFVGMRGKKADEQQQQQLEELDPAWFEQLLAASKRSGFVGMRGKKAGFVGMRGKKGQQQRLSSYFDLPLWSNQLSFKTRRGSSGFVGMRG